MAGDCRCLVMGFRQRRTASQQSAVTQMPHRMGEYQMINEYKLSVIIPVYNTENYLKQCLESLVNQSYRNLELIVVDDCSAGNCAEIVLPYCGRDSRVRLIRHEKNRGLFQARLSGAEKATGDYIAFVDSDDYVSSDFYRELMQLAVDEQCSIAAGNTVRDYGSRLSQYTLHKICFDEEPLTGAEVRNRFYSQEGSCYAWHTVWNKIYSMKLWKRCEPYYKQINRHVIMCEDVAFSSVLFYFADKFAALNSQNNCYYYCLNPQASTNTGNDSIRSYKKKLEDLNCVFDFVASFLTAVGAEEEIRSHFRRFRLRYYFMWKASIDKRHWLSGERQQLDKLLETFRDGMDTGNTGAFSSFEVLESDCSNEMEKIRQAIAAPGIQVVSFDIFDTLLLRPVWNPEDVFELMQKDFETLFPSFRTLSFRKLRQAAEETARAQMGELRPGFEDVNIDEIYQRLQWDLEASDEQISKLCECEKQMELSLSLPRQSGKELYSYAQACGKTVILVSDMYLDMGTIEKLLAKAGYTGYARVFLSSRERVTKTSGRLFDRVLRQMELAPGRILHIGDNPMNDVGGAQAKGIRTAYLPKAKDCFCNEVKACPTNRLSLIGALAGGYLTVPEKLHASIGYRSMAALVSNKLFDNPYSSWNDGTDFDANPYVMGYYAVGMHLVGITAWLAELVRRRHVRQICFLSRDGYLPMMAMEAMRDYFDLQGVAANYVPCSRQCLMPWIINNADGLYALPVELRSHTPMSILKLLRKYFDPSLDEAGLERMVKAAGFVPDAHFTQRQEYTAFIRWFKSKLFDEKLLEREKALTARFYRERIPEGSLVFDLGYSGRIPAALQSALAWPVIFAYVHEDRMSFPHNRRREHLDTELMYSFVPPYSDLIREFFLSEYGNSCIGITERDGVPAAEFSNCAPSFDEQFTTRKVMEGSRRFIADFTEAFSAVKELIDFDPCAVSMPFEGLIHASEPVDRKVLYMSASDDQVYGARETIPMDHFWCTEHCEQLNQDSYQSLMYGKSKAVKLAVYTLIDRGTLKKTVKSRYADHPIFLRCARDSYNFAKKIKNKVKGE